MTTTIGTIKGEESNQNLPRTNTWPQKNVGSYDGEEELQRSYSFRSSKEKQKKKRRSMKRAMLNKVKLELLKDIKAKEFQPAEKDEEELKKIKKREQKPIIDIRLTTKTTMTKEEVDTIEKTIKNIIKNKENKEKNKEKKGTCGKLYALKGKRFAIKQIHKEAMKTGGAKELQKVAKELQELHEKLKHENIINLYGIGVSQVDLYLIIDYHQHGNMEVMMEKQAIPEDVIAEMTYQILKGLKNIHEKEIVHNDIKPSNILMDKDGRVVIAHLGMASKMTHGITGDLTHHNTYSYMSPERFFGKPNNASADIFSLGMSLVSMAKGKHPFLKDNPEAVFNYATHFDKEHVLIDHKEAIEGLSETFVDFISKCDNRDATKRSNVQQLLNHPFVKAGESRTATQTFLKK